MCSSDLEMPADDLLSAQDEAVRQIASSVKAALARGLEPTPARPEAQVEYQRGLHAQRAGVSGDPAATIEHAMRATDIDPGFAPAQVLLADTYNRLGLLSLMKPRTAFHKARLAAERALALDADLATAHGALGLVRLDRKSTRLNSSH